MEPVPELALAAEEAVVAVRSALAAERAAVAAGVESFSRTQ